MTYSYGKVLSRRAATWLHRPHADVARRPGARSAIELFQWATGYAFADAVMQHSVAELEDVSIDIGRMQARRDRFVGALRAMGYGRPTPRARSMSSCARRSRTTYVLGAPCREHDVLVLPGTVVEFQAGCASR